MPDPTRETVSSTEIAGLFGISPWVTEWMLYQRFANGLDIDKPSDDRMQLGLHFQRPLLELVARELRLDVEHFDDRVYFRHTGAPIGASMDGKVVCPSRGVGIVETKWIDWRRWRDTYTFDDTDQCVAGPAYYELQLHIQMQIAGAEWGVLATMVGGNDLVLLERVPDAEVWERCLVRVAEFMQRVERRDEPGIESAEDLAFVERLVGDYYPTPPLDLRGDSEGHELEDLVLDYERTREQRLELKNREDELKARSLRRLQQLGDGGDAPAVVFTDNGTVRVSKGDDTFYRLPEPVERLLGMMPENIADDPELEHAAAEVRALEKIASRRGATRLTWKELD